jgi:methionyl-tRNA formyltransferase
MIESILFFAKDKPHLQESLTFLRKKGAKIFLYIGEWGDPFPKQSYLLKSDLTISYLSPWIIPPEILTNTRKWAINFHPGPPEYPGIGCTNMAIYNGENYFGVTAHLMEEKVDTGKIIRVTRFPVKNHETVYSLTMKCYDYIFILFKEVIEEIYATSSLQLSYEKWQVKPRTRKELEQLAEITSAMPREEVQKRIKAMTYPGMPGAFIKVHDFIFRHSEE